MLQSGSHLVKEVDIYFAVSDITDLQYGAFTFLQYIYIFFSGIFVPYPALLISRSVYLYNK